jgi:hypothetical protein
LAGYCGLRRSDRRRRSGAHCRDRIDVACKGLAVTVEWFVYYRNGTGLSKGSSETRQGSFNSMLRKALLVWKKKKMAGQEKNSAGSGEGRRTAN